MSKKRLFNNNNIDMFNSRIACLTPINNINKNIIIV